MSVDPGKDQWIAWARERAASGSLDQMVVDELFDHTWAASGYHLRRLLNPKPRAQLLEAGSGWGRLIHALKYHDRSLHIDGYELTEEFVKKARDVLKMHGLDENVSIRQADLLTVQLPRDAYDGFYSSRVIHYIEEKELVTRKLFECLKPGGRGVFIIPNSKCPYRWLSYRHAPLYPIHKLADLMQKVGFRDISQGGYGFLPAKLRISHGSYLCTLDKILSRTPIGRFAGLAYVVGSR